MAPREWWVVQTLLSYTLGEPVYRVQDEEPDELTKRMSVNCFRVREVALGSATVTREELRKLWYDVWDDENTFDSELRYIEDRLFGPEEK
jgi:hypothetical protein